MRLVVIGNGAAALSAVETFRKYDKESEICIVTKEKGVAYSRVLLPYILRGKLSYDDLFIRNKEYYETNNIKLIEEEVVGLDEKNKTILFKNDEKLNFDKLLIATGSHAAMPPIEGIGSENVFNLWTKSDLEKLLPLFETKKKVCVIGSGFVALQGAWSAKSRGLDVEIIEIADKVMPSVLDETSGKMIEEKIAESGIKLNKSTLTKRITPTDEGIYIEFENKTPILVDFVIVGTGVRSNTSFLEGTSVEMNRGVLVNPNMQTNVKDIYAAGDVALGPSIFGDDHVPHALWPTAIEMGKVAGANIAGKALVYEGSLNMNVTQMYGVTVASMGLFKDEDIDDQYYFDVEDGYGHLKICYKQGKMVGACLVGSTSAVKILGKLRTIIKKDLDIQCDPKKIEAYLNLKVFANR